MEENRQKGFVKIYRSILEWEWYSEPNTAHLFLYLILKANYKPKKWKGKMVGRGELITSINHISRDTGLSISMVKTALSKLIKSGCIHKKSTNKYTALRVINYGDYQEVPVEYDKPKINKEQSNDRSLETTKEIKKNKESKRKKIRESKSPLPNFEYLSIYFKDEIENIITRNWIPENEMRFCLAKFNEKRFKNISTTLFENFLVNWKKNLEKDDSINYYQHSVLGKRLD